VCKEAMHADRYDRLGEITVSEERAPSLNRGEAYRACDAKLGGANVISTCRLRARRRAGLTARVLEGSCIVIKNFCGARCKLLTLGYGRSSVFARNLR